VKNLEEEYALHKVKDDTAKPVMVTLLVDEQEVQTEVDTGASLSFIPWNTYQKLKKKTRMRPSTTNLRTYSGERVKVLGILNVEVEYNNQKQALTLMVVEGNGPRLLGRHWLTKIGTPSTT
jgi:predicted aspartyl protease